MDKDKLDVFVHKKLNYWWGRLGLTSTTPCTYRLANIEGKNTTGQVFIDNRYGSVNFVFDANKLEHYPKKEVEHLIIHECSHVLVSEITRVAKRVIDVYVEDEKAKKLAEELIADEEESFCDLLADKLGRKR